jgi:IstB-like ATP binding N-terminal./IstB-like ATP binding protein.
MTLQCTMDQLRELRLSGMLGGLEQQLSQTTYQDLSFEDRLGQLVDAEISHRQSQRFQRLLKNAKLKVHADPESIDYRPSRGLDRSALADVLSCNWIDTSRTS